MVERDKQIQELQQEIEEIQASLPAHSTPPAMLLRLEELEEQLEELIQGEGDAAA